MKRLRVMLLVVSVAGVSLALASCGGGGGGGGETSLDMTIGDSVPLSGGLADFGPPGEKAADVAIDVINDSIEDSGVDHTVNIVHEDNCGGDDQQCAVQA